MAYDSVATEVKASHVRAVLHAFFSNSSNLGHIVEFGNYFTFYSGFGSLYFGSSVCIRAQKPWLVTTTYGRKSFAIKVAMDDDICFALSELRWSSDNPSSIVRWLAAKTGGIFSSCNPEWKRVRCCHVCTVTTVLKSGFTCLTYGVGFVNTLSIFIFIKTKMFPNTSF